VDVASWVNAFFRDARATSRCVVRQIGGFSMGVEGPKRSQPITIPGDGDRLIIYG